MFLFVLMRVFAPVVSARLCTGSSLQRSFGHSRPPTLTFSLASSSMGRKKVTSTSSSASSSDGDPRSVATASLRDKLALSLERLKKDLAGISAGKASPDLLAKVTVEAHGMREPLSKVAQVAVKDHQTLLVNVFDPDLVKSVATAIQDAQLQLNPQVLGSSVKVMVPRITKEFRDQLAKRVADAGEEAKIALRKHRHDVLGIARKNKDSALSKDEAFLLEEELTKLTKVEEKKTKKTSYVLISFVLVQAAEKKVVEEIERKTKEVSKAD